MKSKFHKAASHLNEFLADADDESIAALQTKLTEEGVNVDAFLRRLEGARPNSTTENLTFANAAKQIKGELCEYLAKFKSHSTLPEGAFARDQTARSRHSDNRSGKTDRNKQINKPSEE